MSLIGALNVGKSALMVSEASLQVTGNNIANAGNPNYSVETSNVAASVDQQLQPGVYVGTGVELTSIQRQVDVALQARLDSATSDQSSATASQQWLGQVESVFNAMGTQNLSTQMDTFFNDWSTLANNPTDVAQRQVVIQDGQALAQQFQSVRTQLTGIDGSIDQQLQDEANSANQLSQQIASLNGQIIAAQGAGGQPNALLDQRDAAVQSLSKLMNVQTVDQPNGAVNVYVGSEPLVTNTSSAGVALTQKLQNGTATDTLSFASNGGTMNVTSGELGGLISSRQQTDSTISSVDSLAGNLVFELNKIYSSGQGLNGFTSVSATNTVADANAPLDSATADLPFTPNNGSFVVSVKQTATGLSTSSLVPINLGSTAATPTTLNSLAADLSQIAGVQATIVGGQLQIKASPGCTISFSQDSSGTLAALGVNSFFTGTNASDIAVNSALTSDPTLLAAAKNGDNSDNQTALAIAAMGAQPVTALNGQSINDAYQSMINTVAVASSTATSNVTATQTVVQTLQTQSQSISGVSINDEAVNMIQQQHAFQAASQLINTVNQMMQDLLQITV